MDLFYSSINLTFGNGEATMFWHSPWLGGFKPKDIAHSIINISMEKNFLVSKGL
jgi:hypothetical protein